MRQALLILFGFINTVLFSQNFKGNFTIQQGPNLEVSNRNTYLNDIIGYDKDAFYCLEQVKHNLCFTKYDNNMKLLMQTEIPLKYEGKKMYYQMSLMINDKLVMFTSFENNKTKKQYLFSQTVDKHNLTPQGDLKKIAEIDYSNYSRWNIGSFDYSISANKEYLLVNYNLPYDKNNSERYGLIIFDKNLNPLWSNEVALPYKDKECTIVNFIADNTGDAHLLCKIKKEKDVRQSEKADYEYHIFSYLNKGKTFNEIIINPQDKIINEVKIGFNKQNNIICAGFYSDKNSSGFKGACFLTIDPLSGKIITENYKEVAADILSLDVNDKERAEKIKAKAEKKSSELYYYDLDHLILREDGGAILTAEKYYTTSYSYTTYTGNGTSMTRTVTVYHYDDIIVVNINSQGQIDWIKKISKFQQSESDGGYFLSYTLAIVKDRLYFVYNSTQKEVLNQENPGAVSGSNKSLRESVIAICEIDLEGNETTDVLMRGTDLDVYIRPKSCQQIKDDELLLYGLRRKTRQFIKVIY